MTSSPTAASDRPGASVAYLVSHYPAISHAFIEREVLSLRDLGAEVHTFSVRPATVGEQLSETSRREAESTYSLLGRPLSEYARAHAALLKRSPGAWLAGLRNAATSGPRGLKPRVWQFFYLAEAVLLRERLRDAGVRHLHVHFANNGADVARSVVHMGRAEDGPAAGWRWSFSMHGPTEFEDVEGHDLAAKVESADLIACISEYCRDRLQNLTTPEHWDKMSIVRMGVDASRFAPAPREERDGPLRVLFVGRLVPEKGPDVLLQAVTALAAEGVEVELVVAGGGALADDLAQQRKASAATERIRLLGPVGQDDIRDWYAWADVFCLPSYAEGVPVVLMEALAMEVPVVTTRIAGIPELVEDGVNGFLVEPGRPVEVARALRTLADDAALRRRMGAAGRRRVQDEFQPRANAQRLLEQFSGHRVLDPVTEGIPS
ncbi:glycosyltransferase [Kineococcus sp. DHX-1]|uniref:glycosyltransferase n=1 Tax=Kineococcus sp. DHX-1 TaxID=3349638 RepID=UPI0036D25CB0